MTRGWSDEPRPAVRRASHRSALHEGASVNTTALDVFACPLSGTRLIEASAGTGKTFLAVACAVDALERHGVRRVDPVGERFDPHRHQAMFEAQDPSVPAGTVTVVMQAGYVIGEPGAERCRGGRVEVIAEPVASVRPAVLLCPDSIL